MHILRIKDPRIWHRKIFRTKKSSIQGLRILDPAGKSHYIQSSLVWCNHPCTSRHVPVRRSQGCAAGQAGPCGRCWYCHCQPSCSWALGSWGQICPWIWTLCSICCSPLSCLDCFHKCPTQVGGGWLFVFVLFFIVVDCLCWCLIVCFSFVRQVNCGDRPLPGSTRSERSKY